MTPPCSTRPIFGRASSATSASIRRLAGEAQAQQTALAMARDAQRKPLGDPPASAREQRFRMPPHGNLAIVLVEQVAAELGEIDAACFAVIAPVVPPDAKRAIDRHHWTVQRDDGVE